MSDTAAAEMDTQDWAPEPSDDLIVGDGISDDSTLDLFAKDDATEAPVEEAAEEDTEPEGEVADEDADEVEADSEDEPNASEQDEDLPEFTIKVNGEERTVTLDELQRLAQMGDDYTRKTQQLAAERERLAPYANLDAMLASNPLQAIKTLQEAYGININADDMTDEVIDPAMVEIQELKQWREAQEAEARANAIYDQATSLAGSEEEALELLQFCTERNVNDLETGYWAMKQYKAEQERAENFQLKVKRKRSAPPVEGGKQRTKAAVAPGANAVPKSIAEAFEMAKLGS